MDCRFFFLHLLLLVSTIWLTAEPHIVRLGPSGGDVRSLAVHPASPNTFFLGTADGQIYISSDAGENWSRLSPGLNRRDLVVDNLTFDPQDPNTLYAATWELRSDKGWLFRTRNGGETWENIPLRSYHSSMRAVAIAPSDPQVIALGITEGVVLSTDAGKTWDRISRGYRSLYHVESLVFDPHDSHTLYVGTWHLGWKTTNRGRQWQPIHQGMVFDSDMFSLLVDPDSPQTLYSSACTGVYKSVNGGLLWTKLKKGLPKEARRTRTLQLDPLDSNTIYAGTTLGLFVSHDGGDSWQRLFSDVTVNAIVVHPKDNRIILIGTDEVGVVKSHDRGATLVPANRGFIHRQIAALAAHPNQADTYYAGVSRGGQYGGFVYSNDEGRDWEIYNEGLDDQAASIKAILPAARSDIVYVGTSAGVFAGVPGQRPWQMIESTRQLSVSDLIFSDVQELGLFLAGETGVFYLNLKGQNIQQLSIPVYEGKINTLLYDHRANLLFAGSEVGVFRSNDRGKTWSIPVQSFPDSVVHVLEKSRHRLFCGTRNGLFFSDDNGETWSRCEGVFPIGITTVKSNPLIPDQLYAADPLAGYLFHSEDGGVNWTTHQLGTSYSRIAMLVFGAGGNLMAGTLSEGVYRIMASRTTAGSQ